MKKPLLHKQGFLKVYQAPIPIPFGLLLPGTMLPAQSHYKTIARVPICGNAKILMFSVPGQNLQSN
ncbi:hypothetical protein HDC90_002123 [Pedobacter sp. AK013]|nr:hypothetical protein [Pedobacter sp. AK013]